VLITQVICKRANAIACSAITVLPADVCAAINTHSYFLSVPLLAFEIYQAQRGM